MFLSLSDSFEVALSQNQLHLILKDSVPTKGFIAVSIIFACLTYSNEALHAFILCKYIWKFQEKGLCQWTEI